jgi:Family of unknown function (DUF6962)
VELSGSPAERTTAATDVLLSLTAAAGILWLHWFQPVPSWRIQIWSWSFGLIALSAALGAISHGLVLAQTLLRRLWAALTLALGLAVSLFVVGVVHDLYGMQAARRFLPVMLLVGVGVFLVSRKWAGLFIVFIVFEGAALATALAAYMKLAAAGALDGAGLMAAGVLVSMAAAAAQAVRCLHLTFIWEFDHNGIFHLLQTAGLMLLCQGIAEGR